MQFKKWLLGLLICFGISNVYADQTQSIENFTKNHSETDAEKAGFEWSVDVDMVSHYLFRAAYCGGLSFQPSVTLSYGGLYANAWTNVGATDWTFSEYNYEFDLAFGFSRWGFDLSLMLNHYQKGYGLFDGKQTAEKINSEVGNTAELCLEYTFPKIPLSLFWGTYIYGADGYSRSKKGPEPEDDDDVKRAYSTFIQVGYEFELPQEIALETKVAITPWKSFYTNYEGNFACAYIGLLLSRTWELNDHVSLRPNLEVCLNPYKVDKYNVVREIENRADQRFHCVVGLSLSIY